MNEYEIANALHRFHYHPELGEPVVLLNEFKDIVNASSDGWPYWTAAVKAAAPLMVMIEGQSADHAAFKKAKTRLRTFCTKHRLTMPRSLSA